MKQPIPFGKYYLLERINVGGMAEVFKAKATGVEGFERLVAVKRILPSIAEDEEFITMFVDEAKIAVQLTHANIAQIFDLGRVEGSYFIALEYVHGKDLRAMFNRSRQRGEILPIPLSCYAIMKLCEGLDYAHNKHDSQGNFLNLVHRDVSPQNILISYEGEVKIIDFGIAKAAGKVGRTQAGILKGKFGYMSPEQVLGLEIDRRSDVFGVGICLYELLTGERLFIAETDFATLEKVRSVDIMPPSTYNRRIPEELEQIVMRALARDRDIRYQTAMQLHDELQAFMHTSGNLFSRKDLSAYMHRVFSEEIDKETARDHEYALLDAGLGGGRENDLATFDAIEPVSTVSALNGQPEFMGAAAAPALKPEVRARKPTLLGIPHATGLRAPTVPRLVPNPASVPPVNPNSRPSIPSRPPVALATSEAQGMDWDEDELSTQIYDRPDHDDHPDHDTDADDDDEADGLANLHASVPEGAQLMARPVSQANGNGAVRQPTRTLTDTLQPYSSLQPAAAREPTDRGEWARAARGESARWTGSEPKGKPMVVAIVAVIAIVACIVLGLMLFGQREPGTLNLTTQPRRVAVSVDGRSLGVSNSPFVIGELSAGQRHEIVVSSPGFRPWTKSIELQSGEVVTIADVELERIDTGFSLSSEPPGALVLIDGKSLGRTTPLKVVDLTQGDHRVRIELPGYAPWESSLHATTGTVLPLPSVTLEPVAAEPPPDVKSSRGWSWRKSSSARGDRNDSEPSAAATVDEPAAPPPPPPVAAAEDKPSEPSPPRARDDIEPSPYRAHEAPSEPPPSPAAEPAPAATEEKIEKPAMGKLRVNTRPWSRVFVDGKAYGATPRMNIDLSAGAHTLKLVNEEFNITKTMEIEIVPGKPVSVVLDLLE